MDVETCSECGQRVTEHRTWCRHRQVPDWEARDRTLDMTIAALKRAKYKGLLADEEGVLTAVSEAAIMLAEVASTL